MSCDISEEQLWSLLDRDAPELEEHLAVCSRCRALAERFRRDIQAIEAASRPHAPPLPQRIASYFIKRLIGEGGQALVYEAEQQTPPRAVALKLLKHGRFADEETLRRFQREAKALALAKHPSIPAIHDFGWTEEGLPYFTMELISGTPLTTYVRDHRLSLAERLKLFRRICMAIYHAHQRGVFHRDLKPSNILIDADGTPKVLDFGLARLTGAAEETLTARQTKDGQVLGTLPYMSPEQAEGQRDAADALIDVYALGVILYELLTGQLPYDVSTSSLSKALDTICRAEPSRPSAINPGVPKDLDEVALAALKKEPSQRYQSALTLAEHVELYLTNRPIPIHPPSVLYRFRKLARRHKALSVGGLVAILGLLLGFALAGWQAFRATRQRDRAVAAEQVKEEVLTFLLHDVLGSINPERAAGVDVTVRQVLDLASKQVETRFAGRPQVEAAFRETIGRTYWSLGLLDAGEPHFRAAAELRRRFFDEDPAKFTASLGDLVGLLADKGSYDQAEALCRDGLEFLRQRLGAEHVQVANCLSALANLLDRKGDFEAAESRWREVIEMRRKLLGAEHVDVATAMKELAWVLQAKGQDTEATQLHRDALAMLRRLLGDQAPDTVAMLSELAWLLDVQGEHVAAEELYREVLAMRRKQLGDQHPLVADSLSDLAGLLQRKGEFDAAEPPFREALEIRRTLMGAQHPVVADSLTELGRLLRAKGDYTPAEPLFREALEIRRKLLGAEHWQVASSMDDLALLLQVMGNHSEAETLLQNALDLRRNQFGPDHWQTAKSLSSLARLLHAQGNYAEAESRFREALAIYRQLFGDEHPHVADLLRELAKVLRDKGEYVAAESMLHRSLDTYRSLFGDESPETTYALVDLGLLLIKKGDPESLEQAASILREVIAVRQRTLREGHWLTASAESTLGECLTALGRYEQAEPLLLNSYRVIDATLGAGDKRVLAALERIIHLYDAWGKPDSAAEYRELLPEPLDAPE